MGSIVKAVGKVTGFFKNMNPLVSLGITLFLSWVFRKPLYLSEPCNVRKPA